MSQTATARHHLEPAPADLALVQDLLNTRVIGRHGSDLLATVESARDWLHAVLPVVDGSGEDASWIAALSDRDLRSIRLLREGVENLVNDGHLDDRVTPLVATRLAITGAGVLRLEPAGRGWHRLAALVWTQVFLAQQADTWRRLKLCRNPPCNSAFYDRSRNNSAVWHDVRVCGNAANLRASRARRKSVAQ